jgi:hypothetical protein
VRLYYRLGLPADAKLLEDHARTFHGVTIGANIAAWGQSWVAGLLARSKKPYFVDPLTYVFSRDPELILKEDEVRQSYAMLIERYGRPLPQIGGRRPLRESDFREGGRLTGAGRKFVDSVLNFERRALTTGEQTQRRISDYLEMIGEKTETPSLEPEFLVPPYFYAVSLDDGLYRVSLEMARYASASNEGGEIAPVVCISDRILRNESAARAVVNDYADFRRVLVWISNFDETKVSPAMLLQYGRLVEQLSSHGVETLALYGGFFSLALSLVGLSGFSAGVCYAEWKDVAQQARGGGAPVRYYVPFTHVKTVLANALTFYTQHPEEFCRCSVCKDLTRDTTNALTAQEVGEAMERLDRATAGRHFLNVRASEARLLKRTSKSAFLTKLESDLKTAKQKKASLLGVRTQPLNRWIDILDRL